MLVKYNYAVRVSEPYLRWHVGNNEKVLYFRSIGLSPSFFLVFGKDSIGNGVSNRLHHFLLKFWNHVERRCCKIDDDCHHETVDISSGYNIINSEPKQCVSPQTVQKVSAFVPHTHTHNPLTDIFVNG
jgi:hypothetical protein